MNTELDNALTRIGYLEEAMRHINDESWDANVYRAMRRVRVISEQALRLGNPLTCPEARTSVGKESEHE